MAVEEQRQLDKFLTQPLPEHQHELKQSLQLAKNLLAQLNADNEDLHNRLQLVNEMDELGNGGPLQGATSMAVSFGGRIVPDVVTTRIDNAPKDQLFGDMTDSDYPNQRATNTNVKGNKNKNNNNNNNNKNEVDSEAQRILSKKKSKHDRFFSTYNLLSREINNPDQMVQQLGTFESIVRYHKSAMTYNSIVDNLSMQFKLTQDSLADVNDQLKQYKSEIEEDLDKSNLDHYKTIMENTISSVLSEGRKWLDCIDQIKDEFSGAKALVHPDHQKVANYEIKLRELQASLPVEATAKLAALGVLPEFVKKALDDEDIEEEEKQKQKSKQKGKKKKGGKGGNQTHHEQKRTLLINDDLTTGLWEDPSDDAEDDGGYSADDLGYGADEEEEFEDPNVVAYNELLATANIIKNTILQKIDTAKTFIEADAIKTTDDLGLSSPDTNKRNKNKGKNNESKNNNDDDDDDDDGNGDDDDDGIDDPKMLGIPNADGDDEDDLRYDRTPDVYNPMSKFDESIVDENGGNGKGQRGGGGGQYNSLVDSIEDELKQFADVLVRAGEYVHPSQRALIFACKEIVKQRTENSKLRKRIDHLEGELTESRQTLDTKQTELDNIHTEARKNGGVLKVYAQASNAVINGLTDEDLKEMEMSWLPEFGESMRTINKQCNELDNLLVVSEENDDSDYVLKTVRKNIDNEKVVQTISDMKDSVRDFCKTVMKVYHLVPPHIEYIRNLEDEYHYSKGYCRTKFSELEDKKDEIFYRDSIIREKQIMIEELENRLARIMTSAAASAETRMEALMGMNMKVQSFNKIMDVVSEEMEKRNEDLSGLEDKCKRHLDSSSFRKVKKFLKELTNKNSKSKDIMRSEMENARLYVHSDRQMVDKLQAQVVKLKNEVTSLQERIENGDFEDDDFDEKQQNGMANGIANNNDNNDDNNNNTNNNNNNNNNTMNKPQADDSNDGVDSAPLTAQRSIKFGADVVGDDDDESREKSVSSTVKKASKHRSGKSVHDIAFRQHMLEMDEEIDKMKKSADKSQDVSNLNAQINELTSQNDKLNSEIAHLRRSVEMYQNKGDNFLYDESGSGTNNQGGNNHQLASMQEEIYRLRSEKDELQEMINQHMNANPNYETPGGPNDNIHDSNVKPNINSSNSLLYDGPQNGGLLGGMNDNFDTPGGPMDGDPMTGTAIGGTIHDEDGLLPTDEMTMTAGGQFMYHTPQGPEDAAATAMGTNTSDYEEDSLVLLTKQLQKQNQYIMELTTKIKRLEMDFVTDKQKLLESTCKEIDHLRGIIRQFKKLHQK